MAVAQQLEINPVFDCDTTVEEFDLVYVSAAGVLKKAKADSPSTMPAIGWVEKKLSDTKCQISRDLLISGLTGVTNKAKYYVSEGVAGAVQEDVPTDTGTVMQKVGQGIGTTKIYGQVDSTNYVIRNGD